MGFHYIPDRTSQNGLCGTAFGQCCYRMGGRSGARGKDLVLSDEEFAEIKTCYRVDQLGKCNDCGVVISPIETVCHECGSKRLKRNDDSKWLIGIRHNEEFESILEPKYYYLVLFEFTDMESPGTIRASIWRVDPNAKGFSYCMIDYYKNIRSSSSSKAPFNLWPFSLKFDLMVPTLIYRSFITKEHRIHTEIFPARDPEQKHCLNPFVEYSQSRNLTREKIISFSNDIGAEITPENSKRNLLKQVQQFLDRRNFDNDFVADKLAKALYLPDVEEHMAELPRKLKEQLENYSS